MLTWLDPLATRPETPMLRLWFYARCSDIPGSLVPSDVCASPRSLHLVRFGREGPPPGSLVEPRAAALATHFLAAGLVKDISRANQGRNDSGCGPD